MDLQPFHAFVKDLPRLALAVAAAAGDGQHENARAAGPAAKLPVSAPTSR